MIGDELLPQRHWQFITYHSSLITMLLSHSNVHLIRWIGFLETFHGVDEAEHEVTCQRVDILVLEVVQLNGPADALVLIQ